MQSFTLAFLGSNLRKVKNGLEYEMIKNVSDK